MARKTSNLADTIKDNLFVIIMVSILLLLCIWYGWTYYTSEKITYTKYILKERAIVNSYYAAELFLNQEHSISKNSQGANSFAYSKLDMDLPSLVKDLPKLQHKPTLIIKKIGKSLNSDDSQILIDWIEQGGHLITFSSQNSLVQEEDWKKVQNRLKWLNKGSRKSTQFIKQDEQLNNLLDDIHKNTDDRFLQNLGIYNINVETRSDTEIQETIKKTKGLYKRNKQILTVKNETDSIESKTIMIHGAYSNLDSSLFFMLNPLTKKRKEISFAKGTDIRKYLTEQIKKLDAYIISFKKFKKYNLKKSKDYSVTPQEQKESLKNLLKLSDNELGKLFTNRDVFLDANYGKGRITVLNEATIWKNPNGDDLADINQRHRFLEDGTIVDTNLLKSEKNYPQLEMFSYPQSIYSNENAILLKKLTQNSHSVWLFPNISIDSLPILLWKKARLAIIGLFILTIVWLLSLYNRFGKQQHLDRSQETDIFLYFSQIGKYGWKLDNATKLSNPSRKQAVKIISQSLDLKANEPLKQTHMNQLNKLLSKRLLDKININDEIALDLNQNKDHIDQLLSVENLQVAILPTARDLQDIKEYQFIQYTQTLWLVKWLLT